MIASTVALAILALLQLINEGSAASIDPVEKAIQIVSDPKADAVLQGIAGAISDMIVSGVDSVGVGDIFDPDALKKHIASGLTLIKDYSIKMASTVWDVVKRNMLFWIGARGGDSTGTMEVVNELKKQIDFKILIYLGEKLLAEQVPGLTVEYIENVVKPAVQELLLNNPEVQKAVKDAIL